MKPVFKIFLISITTLLLAEFSIRCFYSYTENKISIITHPSSILEKYYPNIDIAINNSIEENNGVIDILMLGGSVLNHKWGDIEKQLKIELERSFNCPINIVNLSESAHTSLDSRIKFELLQQQHFDLIFLYHGINELRFNNYPDNVYRNDYSHIDFYRLIRSITHPISQYSILPYSFTLLTIELRKLVSNQSNEIYEPNRDWLIYGDSIKTASSFKENYHHIISNAISNNSIVVTSTFAYYIPSNYSNSLFNEKKLDYDKHICSIDIWGARNAIQKGIETHNSVITTLVDSLPSKENILLLDLNQNLDKDKSNFNDICHLTTNGCEQFVDLLLPEILGTLQSNKTCNQTLRSIHEYAGNKL